MGLDDLFWDVRVALEIRGEVIDNFELNDRGGGKEGDNRFSLLTLISRSLQSLLYR